MNTVTQPRQSAKIRRRLQEIEPVGAIRRFVMKSTTRSRAELEYIVTYHTASGKMSCSCAAGEFGRVCCHQDKTLRHIRRESRQRSTQSSLCHDLRAANAALESGDLITAHRLLRASLGTRSLAPFTAPCAHRAEPPYNVRCYRCHSTTADNYSPDVDALGEPRSGRWVCCDCSDALLSADEESWEELTNER